MNYPLRDKIAKDMWQIWIEANKPNLDGFDCPKDFYFMAEIAMKEIHGELDRIVLDVVKKLIDANATY